VLLTIQTRIRVPAADGSLIDTSAYPCTLSAPVGEYRVVACHGRKRRDVDVTLASDVTVEAHKASRTGMAVGIPLASAGLMVSVLVALSVSLSAACYDCTTAQQQAQRAANGGSTGDYTALGVGLAAIAGGVVALTTIHGASLEIAPQRTGLASLSVAAAPTPTGGMLVLSGSS
jgi:hypothetical protein